MTFSISTPYKDVHVVSKFVRDEVPDSTDTRLVELGKMNNNRQPGLLKGMVQRQTYIKVSHIILKI